MSGETVITIIGIALLSGRVHVVSLQRRNGRLIGESHYELAGQAEDMVEVLEQFIPQYYDDGIDVPSAIIIPAAIPSKRIFEAWLRQKKGTNVKLVVPERGNKSHLLQLAEKNAMEKARQHEVKWEAERSNTESALEGLRTALELPSVPHRIEGYDISHLGGSETVGSMVVARDGKSANDQYRSFTIRSLRAGDVDDYKSLQEVLRRRLRYLQEHFASQEGRWKKEGIGFGKARKGEEQIITEILQKHPEELRSEPFDSQEFLVARLGTDIIGFAYLHTLSDKVHELRCLWVSDAYRGGKLGQFLTRKVLRSVKKGKAYVVTASAMEQYYGEAGFRYVIKTPAFLQERLDRLEKDRMDPQRIVLVYEASQNKTDPSLTARPDLLMIDGGKGQLSAVVEVMQSMDLMIPVIGLAKREEEVFLPDRSDPVAFAKDAQAKFLLMRLRDEAHRFANRHRLSIKSKRIMGSALDDIPGIGYKTKADLLKQFGTVSTIRNASDEELKMILNEGQLEQLRKILRALV
jgi:excinuclease UvrABC nuclease subunit